MLVVVSPAKRLDWSPVAVQGTEPEFQKEASRLAGHARQLTLTKLKSLMGLSDDLARLNRDRFQAFQDAPQDALTKPALFAFAGDTYQGFDAPTLSGASLDRAQERLRILSGLYGALRPLDRIQPYRLEMGSRLKTRRGSTLYDFWGPKIANALNEAGADIGADTLINCASQEYFGAVDQKHLDLRVVTPQFLEVRDDEPKSISFFAKRARGALARLIIETDIRSAEDLTHVSFDGYEYQPLQSTPEKPVFWRRDAQAKAS